MGELGTVSAIQRECKRPISSSVSFFGFRADTFSDKDVVGLVSYAISADKRYIVGHHNCHSLYLCHREPRMLDFYSIADHVLIDGMSLVLLGRMFSLPLTRENRATSLDFMPLLMAEAAKHGWRIFYVGSRPGVAELGAALARQEYPGLNIRTHHGYLDAVENKKVIAEINAYQPHILMVGMGMPRQEYWILDNRDQISANVIFPIGAFMDYSAGEIPTAPRWLASLYLEWAYRLFSEPRRLWRRYLVEPWYVAVQVMRHCYLRKKFRHASK